MKQQKFTKRYIGGRLKRQDFEVDLDIDIEDEKVPELMMQTSSTSPD